MCRVQLSLRALHAFSVYTVSVKTALLAAWKTSLLPTEPNSGSVSGRFVEPKQWERWRAIKRKLVSGSKHREHFCMLGPALPPRKYFEIVCTILQ